MKEISNGSSFSNGRLRIFRKGPPAAIFEFWGWPAMCSKLVPGKGWFNIHPYFMFDQMWEGHEKGHEATTEMARRERVNFSLLLETIPERVREVLGQMAAGRWEMLLLLSAAGDEAIKLYENNPALAIALAFANFFRHDVNNRDFREQIVRKQRKIVSFLGFPDAEAVVRIFRKIPPRAILHPDCLPNLCHGINCSPDLLKRLGHLQRINAGILVLAKKPTLFRYLSQGFLYEVSEKVIDARRSEQLYAILDDTVGMLERHRAHICIRTLGHIARVHERYARNAAEPEAEDLVFPDPPLRGLTNGWIDITPLTNTGSLRMESIEMEHCVYGYARRVATASGRLYIYKICAPSRATAAVALVDGRYVLAELRGRSNAKVPQTTMNSTLRWLTQSQQDSFVFKLAAARIQYQIEPGWSIEDLDFDENNVHSAADFDIPF